MSKVLVVEDDVAFGTMLKTFLEKKGLFGFTGLFRFRSL